MKVKLTLEIEVPADTLAEARQEVFDNLTNYAVCRHLEDICNHLGSGQSNNSPIVKYHRQWVDILEVARDTAKLEKL